jgi:hypothetical protein
MVKLIYGKRFVVGCHPDGMHRQVRVRLPHAEKSFVSPLTAVCGQPTWSHPSGDKQ